MSDIKTMDCRNNCGLKIYFDDNIKSASGKSIPLEATAQGVLTGKKHNCPLSPYELARGGKDKKLGKSIYELLKDLQDANKVLEERIEKLELSRWS